MDYISRISSMHLLPFLLILTLLIFLQLFNIDMEYCQKLRIIFYFQRKISIPVTLFILQKQGLCTSAFIEQICTESLLCIETGCHSKQEKQRVSPKVGKGGWGNGGTFQGQTVRFKICLYQLHIWASYLASEFWFLYLHNFDDHIDNNNNNSLIALLSVLNQLIYGECGDA